MVIFKSICPSFAFRSFCFVKIDVYLFIGPLGFAEFNFVQKMYVVYMTIQDDFLSLCYFILKCVYKKELRDMGGFFGDI